MHHFFSRLFQRLESTPLTLGSFALTFTALIVARLTLDVFIEGRFDLSWFQLFFQGAHLFFFFLFSFLLLLPLVAAAGKTSFLKAASLLLFGFLVILFPPIIDAFIFGQEFYWSFYIFDSLTNMPERFFTFFGNNPHLGITYGVRAEVALVTLGVFVYSYAKVPNWRRSFYYGFLVYAALFFLGTLPSWIAYVLLAKDLGLLTITHTNIAELFLSPGTFLGREATDLRSALGYKMNLFLFPGSLFLTLYIWFQLNRQSFLAAWKNLRLPQVFYHSGLLLTGILLSIIYAPASFSFDLFSLLSLFALLCATTFAWVSSIVLNDLYDTKIDAHTNTTRPLITGAISSETYRAYGMVLFVASLAVSSLVSFRAALFLLAYQALAYLYSAPPLRLKRFLGIATVIASAAGMLILFLGYTLLSPSHTLVGLPPSLLWYLFFVLAVLLPLKDFKDVLGDKKDGVTTLPVALGIPAAQAIMSALGFLVFLSSIFVFHTPELLVPALLFGSLAFWIIDRAGRPKSRITFYMLSPLFMLLACLYGISLVIFLW
jgi:chlorophyll/bacteriochlorophyll a synthase